MNDRDGERLAARNREREVNKEDVWLGACVSN